jgi:hypothetical protein
MAKHSEDDFRVLILFKFIKTSLISAMQARDGYDMEKVNSRILDRFCLDQAKQLAALGKDPTEEDIRDFVRTMVQLQRKNETRGPSP